MLLDRCPVCLSVCMYVPFVYCGQTVGWIKIPLGTEVGLRPDDIVLDGDPALPTERGTAAPTFRSMSIVWPNGRPSQQLPISCRSIMSFKSNEKEAIYYRLKRPHSMPPIEAAQFFRAAPARRPRTPSLTHSELTCEINSSIDI